MADLRIAAGGIGHDLRVGTDDTADEFSKIRLRVVLQQHGPNGAEPLRSDADELLLRALASLVLDAFLEPRGAAEELVVELDGAAQQLPKIVRLRQEAAQGVADLTGGLLRNAEPGSHDDGVVTLARLKIGRAHV